MPRSELPPLELVRHCIASGNAAAWEEFVRRFQPVIASTVLKTSHSWGEYSADTVDELIQDTYLRICANEYQALRQFRPQHPNAIFGFIKTIAFSVAHDYFRARQAFKRGPGLQSESEENLENAAACPGRGMSQADRELLLREIDDYLNVVTNAETRERDRQIFWLYYRQGFTARAISQIGAIDLTEKGVESTIRRLTQQVRRELAERASTAAAAEQRQAKGAGGSF